MKTIAQVDVLVVKVAVEKDAADARDGQVSVEDVQNVRTLAKAPVNSDVEMEININFNGYGKRHFISA